MGQLLSAQATRQIPTLRSAFFVGDVLTKRDCTRLQSLAKNVNIINMYGTTETQRAVSYFLIPSVNEDSTFLSTQKDLISAGQGMIDVQLLVVNRTDRNLPCAVGEMGEIYVRSSGLAEGYLDAEATKEKFVINWFGQGIERPDKLAQTQPEAAKHWFGIRDRMYRSGDLGRYLPDGTVECTGRADDQIKIRGFRIELGDIDTHLSRHPLVRENVTLVRRDKDEEKVLVSYFVPVGGDELRDLMSASEADDEVEETNDLKNEMIKGVKRYRRLIKDIREYLKKKLPSYAVPAVYFPLSKLPLNPNGKVDKPALPFPDTTLISPSAPSADLSPTQRAIHDIWLRLLPSPPGSLALDDNFFDMGGHSILATRLIFEIRKAFVVNAPLGLVFDKPTIGGQAAEVDHLRHADLGAGSPTEAKPVVKEIPYGQDVDTLIAKLPQFSSSTFVVGSAPATVFLTGATGFLGAFILRELLARNVKKVITLVRAKSVELGVSRLRESSQGRGVWDESWITLGRLEVIIGDLASHNLGLSPAEWKRIASETDAVLHNGAMVHWVYPYSRLRSANVLSTMSCIELCATDRPKTLTFVSSTSVLDTEEFVRRSDESLSSGGRGLSESDTLDTGKVGLDTGYGQTKWVSERLIMEAGRRGLKGKIVRPGYVMGHSQTAVTNTDDFIWRMIKGCLQLGLIPDINNTVNLVPVDHVALLTVLSAITPLLIPSTALPTGVPVIHVTGHPSIRYNDLLGSLTSYGYNVTRTEYVQWRSRLEQHVLETQDNALFPLLHFVLDDLPTSTKSAELDDTNAQALAKQSGAKETGGVGVDLMGLYISWLIRAGFLDAPKGKGSRTLPVLQGGVDKAIGRSTAGAI